VELTPLVLRRWIRPLALGVLVLSVLGLVPRFSWFGQHPGAEFSLLPLHYVTMAVVGGFALLTVLAERRGLDRRKVHSLLQVSYAVLLFWIIEVLYGSYGNRNFRGWEVITPFSSFLLAVAVPGLWAAAVVRRKDPRNSDTRAFGRMSAWIATTALVIGGLMSSLAVIALFGPYGSAMTRPLLLISSAFLTVSRVLALWAVVETLRRSGTEDEAIARAGRIQVLMVCWLGVSIASQIYSTVYGLIGHDFATTFVGLWRGLVYRLLLVLIAVLAAVDLERTGSGYNSGPPTYPSVGAGAY
jgi:hypothetical protein